MLLSYQHYNMSIPSVHLKRKKCEHLGAFMCSSDIVMAVKQMYIWQWQDKPFNRKYFEFTIQNARRS